MELVPELVAKMLNLIGDLLQQGLLSMMQGRLLSDIENTDIIQLSCDNFIQSLDQEMLNKCFNNLINLQIKGVPLSHWILSLIQSLAKFHRYIAIISIVERYTELLLTQTHNEDTLKLLVNFLILHQHSPALFKRHFHKLDVARQSVVNQRHYIERTVECLMLRFPHFKRTYGSSRIPSSSSWSALYKQLSRSKLRFSAGVGFQNIGNTCYFNSLVQALWLSTPFQQEVIFTKIDSNILSELRRVFLILSYSIKPSFSPDRLYNVVHPPWFEVGSQQDAAELLRHLFDLITSGTVNSPPTSLSIQPESNHPHGSQLLGGRDFSITSSKYHRHHGLPKEDNIPNQTSAPSTIVTNHFEGKLEINISCDTCTNKSKKDESFLFLTLPIPDTGEDLKLANLVKNILQPEEMREENQYHCDRCNLKTNAVRTTQITRLPNLFIFTISRFSYDKVLKCRSKILKKVDIPEEVTFVEEAVAGGVRYHPCSEEGRGVRYRLYAVVVHSGYDTESGHYYTYGVPAGTFSSNVLKNSLCFNDSTVTFMSDLDLINSPKSEIDTPYLLFYHKIQLQPMNTPDLDVTLLFSIVNANIEYLQKLERENGGQPSIPPPTTNKRNDDDNNGDFDFYGGCHDNNFAAGSGHYIY